MGFPVSEDRFVTSVNQNILVQLVCLVLRATWLSFGYEIFPPNITRFSRFGAKPTECLPLECIENIVYIYIHTHTILKL